MSEDEKSDSSTNKENIKKTMDEIHSRHVINKKLYKKMKRIGTAINITKSSLNCISVSSLVLTIGPQLPIFMIIGLCSSSISMIIDGAERASNLNTKIIRYNTTSQQYIDLYRDIRATMKRNNLTSDDYTELMFDINNRLSLIEDSEE